MGALGADTVALQVTELGAVTESVGGREAEWPARSGQPGCLAGMSIASRRRPLARRRLSTLRPPGVAIRAMNPWPGAWFNWHQNLLKVTRASVGDAKGTKIGTRFIFEGRPAVMTADSALVLEEVQPANKKTMSGKSFLAGARDWAMPE